MTGAYLRVRRDGKWVNIEVEHLTDAEREELLQDDPRLMQWLNLVCRQLVSAETFFKELEADGILKILE